MASNYQVHIIGGGLAGCAAWQSAKRGIKVRLSEMRGAGDMTPAHQGDGLAELVCSNSFPSDDAEKHPPGNARSQFISAVPAGSALAVDRDIFSDNVSKILNSNDKC